ncbi:MAG: DUF6036 family nucleotidyltransferase [Bacteroidia bacterium]
MGSIFNQDFIDFIDAFNQNKVEYILVGGFSVIAHGFGRSTGDMDIWVNKTGENYDRIVLAFNQFKMPVFDMTVKKFLSNKNDVFRFGRTPSQIDLLTSLKGVEFSDAFKNAEMKILEKTELRTLSREDLIKAKQASNRLKDQLDIETLRKIWKKK